MLQGTYDVRFVALSGMLAVSAAYAALELVGRVTATRRWAGVLWAGAGAATLGAGIWSTHYLGMLAFHLPVPVLYHYPTVILSLLAAVVASAAALGIVSHKPVSMRSCMFGGVVLGLGISGMHFLGMQSMLMPAMTEYRWTLLAISLLLAIATSLAAFLIELYEAPKHITSVRKFISAGILGSAVFLMHYTAMSEVCFRPSDAAFPLHHAIHVTSAEIAAIPIAVFSVMFVAMGSALLDRRRMQHALDHVSHENDAQFRTLAEAIPQIVWIADAEGKTTFVNKRWHEMTGTPDDQGIGEGWLQSVHPDDRVPCIEKWNESKRSGKTFEIEYRLHDQAKGYRWYLDRAVALRDPSGSVRQWFGTCTDIEEQKNYQRSLEEQIQRRTEELADANSRLQQEMHEKDLARRRLDEQKDAMLHALTERSQRATLLSKMGELLQSCLTREEVFSAALGFAPKIFPNRRGAIELFNSSRNMIEVVGEWHDCQLPVKTFEPEDCWSLRTGHPHLVVAGDSTARCAHAVGVTRTYLCVPILAQGEALGILHIQTTDDQPSLSEAELSFKTTFAAQIALSVANIRLRDELRAQSIKDPLTGLYNRRYLEEILGREIRRAIRSELPLGVLMLDLDHFKKINDTHGHEAGDAVLRETAQFLTRSIRAEDIVCRYGGEEFVIILPTADLHAANMRAERIASKVRQLTVLHQGHALAKITTSIGVATLPEHGTDPKSLLQAADAALYQAKREGRDRVVLASEPPSTDAEITDPGHVLALKAHK